MGYPPCHSDLKRVRFDKNVSVCYFEKDMDHTNCELLDRIRFLNRIRDFEIKFRRIVFENKVKELEKKLRNL